jgi:hypothetical protein
MKTRILTIAALALVSAAGVASADHQLFVGSSQGPVLSVNTASWNFSFLGVCGGPINSMAIAGDHLFLGAATGNVYKTSVTSGGAVSYYLTISGSDNTAMVADEDSGHIFVANTDGTIRRVNPTGLVGQVVSTFMSPIQVDAMAIDENRIYVGGPQGSIWAAPKNSGSFLYFACICSLGPIKSIAVTDDKVFGGDQFGAIQVYNKATGALLGSIWNRTGNGQLNPVSSLVVEGGTLIVSTPTGVIRRFDIATSQFIGQSSVPVEVGAMAIITEPTTPPCKADFNLDGQRTVQDIYDFLAQWGWRRFQTDTNVNGVVEVQDIYDFLTDWHQGC